MSSSITDLAGGPEAFVALVDAFYARVEGDEVLRPMYPEDLGPGKQHLALFLAQYFGATDLYSAQRGHPRLRMRHAPFDIDPDAATRWATHMLAAVADQGFVPEVHAALEEYVVRATPTLINRIPGPMPSPMPDRMPGGGPPPAGPESPAGGGPSDAGGLPTTI
jgi:hemoglobin